jgi:hypothetical protein
MKGPSRAALKVAPAILVATLLAAAACGGAGSDEQAQAVKTTTVKLTTTGKPVFVETWAMTDEAPPNWKQHPPNWKLLLRDGRLKTPYEHFAVIADVEVIESNADLGTQVGPAWMGIGLWASPADVDGDLIDTLALGVGAVVRGEWEVYKTEPTEPPQDMPYAYDPSLIAYPRERP